MQRAEVQDRDFEVLGGNAASQAAAMTLAPGECTGGEALRTLNLYVPPAYT